MRWSILVVWNDGTEEYVKRGAEVARFTKRQAQEQKEFMLMGMDGDCQSINVVRAPRHS